jgi:hypothetical protein
MKGGIRKMANSCACGCGANPYDLACEKCRKKIDKDNGETETMELLCKRCQKKVLREYGADV